jgi:transposase
MYARKKKNKSGAVSVQVIEKRKGKYNVIQTFGSSKNKDEIETLWTAAKQYAEAPPEQQTLGFATATDKVILDFFKHKTGLFARTVGPEKILGAIFDHIGFNAIPDELFKHIVIARMVYPASKLKTAHYLEQYKGISFDVGKIYRFLDTLHKNYKDIVEQISFRHTKKILNGNISVAFYDMTTLYFEAEDEDDLRKIGFSKDGKFQCPQIMIGLLVGEGGYPIGYDIFKGNTFEGHTLIPAIEKMREKYGFEKPIVVADAGLLSKDNLKTLADEGYGFILGARIKNESEKLKKEIREKSAGMKDGEIFEAKKENGIRLVVSFSEKRKRKDVHNRKKGLEKLRTKVKSGKLNKEHINNRGYNKFLSLSGDVAVTVDESKIAEDAQFDGLKGYVTNTEAKPKEVISRYGNLWRIEKAFRISKTDLRIRPIFHYKQKRIEAHICISFVAYAVYKEFERLLYEKNAPFSVQKAIDMTKTVYELSFILPDSMKKHSATLEMSEQQKFLFEIVDNLKK